MLCPTCRCPLEPESLAGETVQRCPSCNGLWFAESQLGRVLHGLDTPKPTDERARRGPEQPACPDCHADMELVNYAHDSGVLVSRCKSCLGIWLADGQLELLAQYWRSTPAANSLGEALGAELRQASRWRRARELLRSRLLSSGVAVAYLLLVALLSHSAEATIRLAVFMILPLACIWFCDGFGRLALVAWGARPMITQATPGDAVAIGGWIALLSPIAALALLYMMA